jgi:S-adenosylmethionine:tRNA ribosyltransferase-isomerase
MKLSEFDYNLPKELIAQRPANPRTHSRLMILKDDKIEHKKFYEIINYFKEGDVLVLNETKVLKIKLIGKKETGGKIEIMLEGEEGKAILKGRAKIGNKILFDKNIIGTIEEKKENEIKIKFNFPIEEVIKKIGKLPIPPYIKEELKSDSEYQTVFAKKEGSFACPTSGLHFDADLLKQIQKKRSKNCKSLFACFL